MRRLIINTLPSTGTIVQQMFKADHYIRRHDGDGSWYLNRTAREIGEDIYGFFLNKMDCCLCSGQIPHTPGIVDLVEQMDIRMILVTRDPRDLMVDYILVEMGGENAAKNAIEIMLPYFQEFIEWMKMPDRVLRVAIEDLRVAPLSGARRIREFAGDIVPHCSASQLVSRVSSYRADAESVKRADLPVYVKDIFKTPEFKALIRAFGYNP